MNIETEWDEEKNKRNLAKHGLSFEDAAHVFQEKDIVTFVDKRHDYGEVRYITFG